MGRILGGGALLLALLVVAWSATAQAAGAPAGFTESTVATGLTQPTAIAFLPDGGLLVTEKQGALKLVRGDSVSLLTTLPVCSDVSMGLLGIAVDPGFSSNGYVYVYRTVAGTRGCDSELGRFNLVGRLTLTGDVVSAGPVDLPVAVRTDYGQHNGGTLRVGIDGKLYLSTGDTGVGDFKGGGEKTLPGESTNPFAQALDQLPGKVLRVNLDGSIPADNPFAGQPGVRGEIFAYGFRNPFRFGIDPVTGLPWLGDVGQSTWEELNVIRPGLNYGWPQCEGTDPPGCPPGRVAPIYEYPTGTSASITGGAFAPCGFGPYGSEYFFGDYIAGTLSRVVPNAARDGIAGPPTGFAAGADGPVDIVFGPDQALYYVAINAGEVRRIAPPETTCGVSGEPPGSPGTSADKQQPLPAAVDSTAPRARLRFRSPQRIGRLAIRLRLDERATVTVTASVTVRTPSTATVYRFRRAHRLLAAGRTSRVTLALRRRSLRALRKAASRGPLTARVRVTAVDGAGNESRERATIRLLRR